MSYKQDYTLKGAPASNYGAAVARALEWLGDRYLLAKPINAHGRQTHKRVPLGSSI